MFDSMRAAQAMLERAAREFDGAELGADEAVAAVEILGTIRRLTDGMLGRAVKRVADTNAHVRHGDRDAAALCARLLGSWTSETRRTLETATRLEALPATEESVRAGRLSSRQAEMITGVATQDPAVEGELLEAAAFGLVPLRDACIAARARIEAPDARAARQHAARTLRVWNAIDGMFEGHFRLTPEVGAAVRVALERATRRRWRVASTSGVPERHDAHAADALADLVGDGSGVARIAGHTVHVLIDHAALARGNARDGERCEIPGVGPVNVRWVRELLGEAFVTAIVRKGRDVVTVAHLGRHIPAELRTAMIVSGRECAVDGCHSRDYLEVDHCEIDHAAGGPTAMWNLAWLCSAHHRRKSHGWRLGAADVVTGKRPLDPPERTRDVA